MVLARLVLVLAVVCVGARGASALTLEGVRGPHGNSRPPLHPSRPAPRDDLLPDDLALDRYEEAELLNELQDPLSPTSHRFQQLISELAEAAAASDSLEDGVPLPAEVAEAVAEAEAAAVLGGGATWGSAGLPAMSAMSADPRYLLANEYLPRPENSGNSRKGRDSRNSRSVPSSTTLTTNNNTVPSLMSSGGSSTGTNASPASQGSPMLKRAWPNSFSRRRSSGLSLSIDASMKVLREALYLEIARKKQRQQLQRAQHNKALLNTIGKRDVAAQLREGRPQHQSQHQHQHQRAAAPLRDDRN